MAETSLLVVFLAALITALATGLGALPLYATAAAGPRALALGAAAASGLMLAASHSLIAEGFEFSRLRTLAGIGLGLVAIMAANRALNGRDHPTDSDMRRADAKKILLIVGIMTAHSAAEGIGVGVSFGGGEALGEFITIAIALHNVPEGLAIALVMVPRGASVPRAAGWAVFSSLPQPLLAVPAYLFVLTFQPWLPVGLGLAAGAMLWMVFAELLPDAVRGLAPEWTGATVTLSFAAMLGATLMFG